MDNWVKVATVAGVIQAAVAVVGFFGIKPPGMSIEALWQVLFVSITLFTWGVLYCLWQEVKRARQKPTMLSPALARKQDNLIIHAAVYGLGSGQDHEVTERVRELVVNGELHIEVRPETFRMDDPYPNKTKRLLVICSYGKKEQIPISRTDYQRMNLPLDIEES